jgi:hypothetical protein
MITCLLTDESVDVRFRLAETSYLPDEVLRQLLADENPYIASRAEMTIARLANSRNH